MLIASLSATQVQGAPFAYVITGNGVSVIDTTTNVVTATVPLAEPAYGVTVNRAGSRVYLAGYRGGAPNGLIQVLDTATNTITGTVSVGDVPDPV